MIRRGRNYFSFPISMDIWWVRISTMIQYKKATLTLRKRLTLALYSAPICPYLGGSDIKKVTFIQKLLSIQSS